MHLYSCCLIHFQFFVWMWDSIMPRPHCELCLVRVQRAHDSSRVENLSLVCQCQWDDAHQRSMWPGHVWRRLRMCVLIGVFTPSCLTTCFRYAAGIVILVCVAAAVREQRVEVEGGTAISSWVEELRVITGSVLQVFQLENHLRLWRRWHRGFSSFCCCFHLVLPMSAKKTQKLFHHKEKPSAQDLAFCAKLFACLSPAWATIQDAPCCSCGEKNTTCS